jgi:hypothetical protein
MYVCPSTFSALEIWNIVASFSFFFFLEGGGGEGGIAMVSTFLCTYSMKFLLSWGIEQ